MYKRIYVYFFSKGFETANHPIQPPAPSLPPFQQRVSNESPFSISTTTMSSSSSGGTRNSNAVPTATSNSSKRTSPLNYFSLDIPANLLGSTGATSNTPLPHQSCSLPFVARLVRTPSTSSSTSGYGAGDSPHHDHQNHFQQVMINNQCKLLLVTRKKGSITLLPLRYQRYWKHFSLLSGCFIRSGIESPWLFFYVS